MTTTVTPIVCPGRRCVLCSQVAQAERPPAAVIEVSESGDGARTPLCVGCALPLLGRERLEAALGAGLTKGAAAQRHVPDYAERHIDLSAAPLSSGSADRVAP